MSIPEVDSNAPILLAEDEETDAILFRLALKTAHLDHPIIIARDGQEVVDYLSGSPPFSNRTEHPLPALLVLDLKMPRMTGLDVLSWLGSRPDFNRIPAVMLSSSSYPEDVQKASLLGAREYFIKPHTVSELAKVLQTAIKRWM